MNIPIIILFVSIYSFLAAETSVAPKIENDTVYISGKLMNCKDSILWLSPMADSNGFKDTIKVVNGDFTFKSAKINGPVIANITNFKEISIPIYFAPGFNILIEGDAKNYGTLKATTTYKGLGSKSNKFWNTQYQAFSKNNTINWFELDKEGFIKNILLYPDIDSLITVLKESTFGKENQDPYNEYFQMASLTSLKFKKMLFIMMYASNHNFSPTETFEFLHQNFDNHLLSNMHNDDYLNSQIYIELIQNSYLSLLIDLDIERNKNLKKVPHYRAVKISEFFKDRTRDYLLNNYLMSAIKGSLTKEELEGVELLFEKVQSKKIKTNLNNQYLNRLFDIAKIGAGREAPSFNLPDTSGKLHSLSDFAGKVILIEFWASWCGPCRLEVPYIKKLNEKYKDDPNIIILSIAVNDNKNRERRYKIIQENQLAWLQLEDFNDEISKKYMVSFFPRTVIIDKMGKIVDANAPLPSEGYKLEEILKIEMEK